MNDDQLLYADLRHLWQHLDPVPDGLAEACITALAMDELEQDYELLTLVDRSREFAGARSAVGPTTATTAKLEFSHGDLVLVLRIAAGARHRRVDGWVTPDLGQFARLVHQGAEGAGAERSADIVNGRFSFVDVPPGLVRIWLAPLDETRSERERFATPLFEI